MLIGFVQIMPKNWLYIPGSNFHGKKHFMQQALENTVKTVKPFSFDAEITLGNHIHAKVILPH